VSASIAGAGLPGGAAAAAAAGPRCAGDGRFGGRCGLDGCGADCEVAIGAAVVLLLSCTGCATGMPSATELFATGQPKIGSWCAWRFGNQ